MNYLIAEMYRVIHLTAIRQVVVYGGGRTFVHTIAQQSTVIEKIVILYSVSAKTAEIIKRNEDSTENDLAELCLKTAEVVMVAASAYFALKAGYKVLNIAYNTVPSILKSLALKSAASALDTLKTVPCDVQTVALQAVEPVLQVVKAVPGMVQGLALEIVKALSERLQVLATEAVLPVLKVVGKGLGIVGLGVAIRGIILAPLEYLQLEQGEEERKKLLEKKEEERQEALSIISKMGMKELYSGRVKLIYTDEQGVLHIRGHIPIDEDGNFYFGMEYFGAFYERKELRPFCIEDFSKGIEVHLVWSSHREHLEEKLSQHYEWWDEIIPFHPLDMLSMSITLPFIKVMEALAACPAIAIASLQSWLISREMEQLKQELDDRLQELAILGSESKHDNKNIIPEETAEVPALQISDYLNSLWQLLWQKRPLEYTEGMEREIDIAVLALVAKQLKGQSITDGDQELSTEVCPIGDGLLPATNIEYVYMAWATH